MSAPFARNVLLLLLTTVRVTADPVILAREGRPARAVVVSTSASAETKQVAETLADTLGKIAGQKFAVETGDGSTGIAVGTVAEFPSLHGNLPDAREAYWLHSHAGGLQILGSTPLAVQDAVWDLLYRLGYRQFFPGPRWEVIPQSPDLSIEVETREQPDFLARRIWYGAGAWDFAAGPYQDWCAKNRAVSGVALSSGHSYDGIIHRHQAVFAAHPEYLALVGEQRKGPKFCIANAGLRQLVVEDALRQMEAHPEADSLSLDPSDGGGWCECAECAKLGSVTDRALLLANEAAVAVNAKYPGKLIGMYAYNYHSPPPHRTVDPHVIVSVATAFIKGGATLEELLEGWAKHGARLGIREYYAVNTWDRDMPAQSRGGNLAYLRRTIPYFHRQGAEFLSAESGDSWAPNGLGHYVAARMLWDVREAEHLDALVDDFLTRAFGPAREPMREFYRQLDGSLPHLVETDQIGRMFRSLAQARQMELPVEVRARLDDLLLYARYAQLYHAYAHAQGADRQAAFEKLMAHAFRMRETLLVHTKALYRDLAARDKSVSLPAEQAWLGPKKQGWKPTEAFFQAELQQFLAEGIERHPLTTLAFQPIAYSENLVSAAPLHLPEAPPGDFGAGRGRQTFYTRSVAPHTTLEWKITGGLIAHYRDRGPVHLQLWQLGGASQTGERETLIAEDRSVPPDGQEHTVHLELPEPGLYKVTIDDGKDSTRVQLASPLPLTIKSSGDDPMSPSYTDFWMLYFYVPRGTRTIGLFGGEHGEVRDSAGRPVFWLNGREPNYYSFEVPEGEDGKLWHMQYARGSVRLLTVPPYFARSPAELLLPAEVVEKDAAGQ